MTTRSGCYNYDVMAVHRRIAYEVMSVRRRILQCAMTCLLNSIEEMSEGNRKIFFYVSFIVGGTLAIGGFAGFATQHRGYAFIVVVSGIFILISTGILWDTMSPHYEASPRPSAEVATAPREDDDPPPDYDSVVRGDTTKPTSVSRSNSKWSLYNQSWCPSLNPKYGYGKTPTSETSCADVVVAERPPSYKQSQKNLSSASEEPRGDFGSVVLSVGGAQALPGHNPSVCLQIDPEKSRAIVQK